MKKSNVMNNNSVVPSSKRKPYVREITPNWWRKLGFYRFYMLRESTAVPAVWFSLILIFSLLSLKGGTESWAGFVGFLQNPVVFIINIIALAAALLHTKTWFDLAPKASIIIVKNQKMAPDPIIKAFWIITVIATLVIMAVAFYY